MDLKSSMVSGVAGESAASNSQSSSSGVTTAFADGHALKE
jgi:prepilin-type processing-associated H-X9-DG protein